MEGALSVYEMIGYGASVLTIISLMMSEVLRLRILNFVAVTIWSVYGYLIGAPAVIGTNVILMVVNVVFLVRLLRAKEYFNLVEVRKNAVFLKEFLNVYRDEIKRFYPGFEYNENANIFTYFALRNVTAAGLFIMELRDDGRLFLLLDFTIPGYRDMKIGRFVYAAGSPVVKSIYDEHEFSQVFHDVPDLRKQQRYLERMGFVRKGDEYVLDVASLATV